MQLTRKQVILISVVSGVVLLLTAAVILITMSPGEEGKLEPLPTPAQTVLPTATVEPSPAPTATVFRLPLVPQWDTPRPGDTPAGTVNAFVPRSSAPPDGATPAGTASPEAAAYDESSEDILAVGLREGRTAALLLLRLDRRGLTVASLPTDVAGPSGRTLEETVLEGQDLAAQAQAAADLAAEVTGRRCAAWIAMDLKALGTVMEVTGPIGGQGPEALAGDAGSRAQGALALMTGAAAYVQRASLLKLPALKRAAGEAFASSLSSRELWNLFWTVRSGVSTRALLAPSDEGGIDLAVVENFFRESS